MQTIIKLDESDVRTLLVEALQARNPGKKFTIRVYYSTDGYFKAGDELGTSFEALEEFAPIGMFSFPR